eukprot:gnl/TRDRNA2_/TRDRNA2_39739_c0_seq1.p1 gnl/TRDRNA2_/TRDRNA2_39739_c0~~gnl/TRDRNA2_/TRDRNA2_39739_c0_seq1.p1  ORF type:complete len:333 (-),score=62.65 gnl/TRDRNA2_/TRDRNA2_39739_c0_seq1:57-1055(-)
MELKKLEDFFAEQRPYRGYGREPSKVGIEFTYGELTIDGIAALVADAKARLEKPIRNFLDLGSGTGKVVLVAAALCPEMSRATGIEASEQRHEMAEHLLQDLASGNARHQRLRDQVLLVHGDARSAVALIASADVVWVSNTCFPDWLDNEIGAMIDRYACEGTLVYSTRNLDFKRKKDSGLGDLVPLGVTWAVNHRAAVHTVSRRRAQPGAQEVGGGTRRGAIAAAFSRWAGGQKNQKLLEGELLPAAMSDVLLVSGVSAETIVEELYAEDGCLFEVCAEALEEYPSGLDLQAFQEVCNQTLEAVQGPCREYLEFGPLSFLFAPCSRPARDG